MKHDFFIITVKMKIFFLRTKNLILLTRVDVKVARWKTTL